MAIVPTKIRKMITSALPKAPNKRETELLTKLAPDIAIDKNGRWPGRCVARATYDFATDGGASGDIVPALNVTLPAKAIVVSAWIDVLTTVTSAGSATVAVTLAAAGDILVATAKASLAATDVLFGTPNGDAINNPVPTKLAADTSLTVTVATADLTAGKFNIYVEYLYPNV